MSSNHGGSYAESVVNRDPRIRASLHAQSQQSQSVTGAANGSSSSKPSRSKRRRRQQQKQNQQQQNQQQQHRQQQNQRQQQRSAVSPIEQKEQCEAHILHKDELARINKVHLKQLFVGMEKILGFRLSSTDKRQIFVRNGKPQIVLEVPRRWGHLDYLEDPEDCQRLLCGLFPIAKAVFAQTAYNGPLRKNPTLAKVTLEFSSDDCSLNKESGLGGFTDLYMATELLIQQIRRQTQEEPSTMRQSIGADFYIERQLRFDVVWEHKFVIEGAFISQMLRTHKDPKFDKTLDALNVKMQGLFPGDDYSAYRMRGKANGSQSGVIYDKIVVQTVGSVDLIQLKNKINRLNGQKVRWRPFSDSSASNKLSKLERWQQKRDKLEQSSVDLCGSYEVCAEDRVVQDELAGDFSTKFDFWTMNHECITDRKRQFLEKKYTKAGAFSFAERAAAEYGFGIAGVEQRAAMILELKLGPLALQKQRKEKETLISEFAERKEKEAADHFDDYEASLACSISKAWEFIDVDSRTRPFSAQIDAIIHADVACLNQSNRPHFAAEAFSMIERTDFIRSLTDSGCVNDPRVWASLEGRVELLRLLERELYIRRAMHEKATAIGAYSNPARADVVRRVLNEKCSFRSVNESLIRLGLDVDDGFTEFLFGSEDFRELSYREISEAMAHWVLRQRESAMAVDGNQEDPETEALRLRQLTGDVEVVAPIALPQITGGAFFAEQSNLEARQYSF